MGCREQKHQGRSHSYPEGRALRAEGPQGKEACGTIVVEARTRAAQAGLSQGLDLMLGKTISPWRGLSKADPA